MTGLFRCIGTEVISRCSVYISLDQVFNGDPAMANKRLLSAIVACQACILKTAECIRRQYKGGKYSRNWDVDTVSLFAQVDAFVQRCRDLQEVCEGQVQFSRRDNVPESQIRSGESTQFPAFGGSHSPETLKRLQDIESDFQMQVPILAGLPYNILDVKNTEFHEGTVVIIKDKDRFIRQYKMANRPLESFDIGISKYKAISGEIMDSTDVQVPNSFTAVDLSTLRDTLVEHCRDFQEKLCMLLNGMAKKELFDIYDIIAANKDVIMTKPTDPDELGAALKKLEELQAKGKVIESQFGPIEQKYKMLEKEQVNVTDDEKDKLEHMREQWVDFKIIMSKAEKVLDKSKASIKEGLEAYYQVIRTAVCP